MEERELRIIIAGSREFDNYTLVKQWVNLIWMTTKLADESLMSIKIISGTARGADQLGEEYAKESGYTCVRFPADWENLGKRAGYIRNEEMAKYAVADGHYGMLVAFWDGESKGTKHMIDLAYKHGLRVYIVDVPK